MGLYSNSLGVAIAQSTYFIYQFRRLFCLILTPDRFALARRPSPATPLLGGLNRFYWSFRKVPKLAWGFNSIHFA